MSQLHQDATWDGIS